MAGNIHADKVCMDAETIVLKDTPSILCALP